MFNTVLQAFTKNSNRRVNLSATPGGAVLNAPYGLPYAKWVAEGKGYRVVEATATAGVAALPTVTAGLTIQNGEPDNGKWYVVHSLFATFEASAAAVESAYIAHCVGMNRVAAATQDLALTSVKPLLAGAGPYAGLAILDLGATVVDDLWMPATTHVSNLRLQRRILALRRARWPGRHQTQSAILARNLRHDHGRHRTTRPGLVKLSTTS